MSENSKIAKIRIDSVGCSGKVYTKPAVVDLTFDANLPGSGNLLDGYVFEIDGQVFCTLAGFTMVSNSVKYFPRRRVWWDGRSVTVWRLSENRLMDLMRSADYGCRSDRERWVRDRNIQIIEWLRLLLEEDWS